MRIFLRPLITAATLFAVVGCSQTSSEKRSLTPACTLEIRAGLMVRIYEKETKSPIVPDQVILKNETSERVLIPSSGSYGGNYGPGAYALRVEKSGFKTYVSQEFIMEETKDGCHHPVYKLIELFIEKE